ncbi:hypothetical protein MY04_4438 [Flammeovirga sp. MY04]|uniref:hypothetical protein n=1 Tax=Flammeovirga sp. MY04 TaxID=1191459 RepID=UPI0008063B30|nr:hypothetical protein [Flammeovirga sp. MY04]ANQ51774.1 hypothetical protein MY04_4438 [Flammeovirga sp. MY04]
MKNYLILLLSFYFFSCDNEITTLTFESVGVSLDYPSNWTEINDNSIDFGIADISLLEGGGSSILLQNTDSVQSSFYGIKTFEEYVDALYNTVLLDSNNLLTENLKDTYLNKTKCKRFSVEKEGKLTRLIQTTYLFNYNSKYYHLILTEPLDIEKDKHDENQKILLSLGLKNTDVNKLL